MAFQSSPVLDFSFKAMQDLREHQYRFVKVDACGQVRQLQSTDELPDGVLQNCCDVSEEATVRILGVSKIVAYDPLVVGTFIMSNLNGTASSSESKPNLTMGRVIGESKSSYDLCSVILTPYVGI